MSLLEGQKETSGDNLTHTFADAEEHYLSSGCTQDSSRKRFRVSNEMSIVLQVKLLTLLVKSEELTPDQV